MTQNGEPEQSPRKGPAIVGLGLAVMSSVGSGVTGLGGKISTEIGTTRTLGYTP